MKNKIKVALCYSGAVRGLLNNLDHVKDVLFSQSHYEIDYYLYADPCGATIHQKDIVKGQEEPQGLKVKKEKPEFICLFEDETEGLEARMQKFNFLICNYHMPYKEQVLQWHSVKKVFDFVLSQEKEYDLYVRLRCDLFPAGKMNFDWSSYDENTVYVPFNAPFGGINDRFAFGSKKAMRVYSNFYDSDIYYTAKSKLAIAEKLGKAWYEKKYSHISTNNFAGGGYNSEYRLLLYLLDNDLNIDIIDNDRVHIGSVRDSDGQIRYSGPDLEKFLVEANGYNLEDLKYDRRWWR
jgi:hypothetical protein